MSRLADRLLRLREAVPTEKGVRGQSAPSGAIGSLKRPSRRMTRNRIGPDTPPPGADWRQTAEFVWERCLDYPAILPGILDSGFILPPHTKSAELVVYDLETIGLSGGAGNTAFLIGLGNQTGRFYRLTQLFLADYPGEAAMLSRYGRLTENHALHVSYNGLSFDSQVLRTRFLLNRLPPPSSSQSDLLYPARRLWRGRLPSLSMKSVEAGVLGFFRNDDLPGSEAPEAWFSWLDGHPDRIDGVFRHNADDVLSLARLLARLEEWGEAVPSDSRTWPAGTTPSSRGMARQWERNNSDREIQWLQAGWFGGNTDCGHELAFRMKRRGDYSQAVEIWKEINASPAGDYRSAIELAKYWEHRRHNPGNALASIERLDEPLATIRQEEELAHRRKRLWRKLSGGHNRP
ncbi:MAG: hypothetical protein B6D68_02455 [spirochete symbiont of Stewartia floridana]|nr:MAG: hypothetical protein B6D68_02455 [spirochete symbiont of Stewartia floridana]